MQTLNSSRDELVNYLEEPFKEHEENLDKNFIDKVGKKRQRKKAESGLEKKKQDSGTCLEIDEMWDSVTNNTSKVCLTKEEAKFEIAKLFSCGKRPKKKTEIGMQLEELMANLEIAVEDDVEQNRQGKPAINKLIKLPLLVEALLKKPLHGELLDHGVLSLLKNWLEPLPDGSLPNLNIRATVLTILNDLHINLEQDCRRQELIKSGLGKVLMFLSKSDEETTLNKYTQEELEEEKRILLTKKAPPKVTQRVLARDYFSLEVVVIREQKPPIGVGRAQVPKAMSLDFKIRPGSKTDKRLEARVKMQLHKKRIHKKIMEKLEEKEPASIQA